jgi:hypothetical protein
LPNDSTDLAEGARRIFAAGAGNLVVNMLDGSGPFTFAIAAGQILDLAVSRVKATGTTATGIVSLR